MKFDLFPDNKYSAYGILRTASAIDWRICVLSSHINGVVFLVLIMTFLENFYLLYSLISCLSVCQNELRQNMCCS